MDFSLKLNDDEYSYDLINLNEDDKQSENSKMSVYSELSCVIDYESEDTLDLTKDCAKKSEEDKKSSLLTKKRIRTTVHNLTKELNQLKLE